MMTESRIPINSLAIESAIAGGSLSLLSDNNELDHWTGDDRVSRAEELLPNIIEILDRQNVDRKEISRIAVSIGPGSFTGIRIGIATALGLKDALGISCIGVSTLEAMAAVANTVGTVIAALPVGRDLICSQAFKVDENGVPNACSEPVIAKSVRDNVPAEATLVFPSIADSVRSQNPGLRVVEVGGNLARLIGLAAVQGLGNETLEPLFLQPA